MSSVCCGRGGAGSEGLELVALGAGFVDEGEVVVEGALAGFEVVGELGDLRDDGDGDGVGKGGATLGSRKSKPRTMSLRGGASGSMGRAGLMSWKKTGISRARVRRRRRWWGVGFIAGGLWVQTTKK